MSIHENDVGAMRHEEADRLFVPCIFSGDGNAGAIIHPKGMTRQNMSFFSEPFVYALLYYIHNQRFWKQKN